MSTASRARGQTPPAQARLDLSCWTRGLAAEAVTYIGEEQFACRPTAQTVRLGKRGAHGRRPAMYTLQANHRTRMAIHHRPSPRSSRDRR